MIPILVAGAGPVGLTVGIELARRGVPCRVIDENASRQLTTRAIVVHARSLEVLDAMGVGDEIFATGHPVHGAGIYAGRDRLLHVSFDELDSPFPFAVDIPQHETERILECHLNTLGVFVERRTTVCGLQQDNLGVSVMLRRSDGSSETAVAPYIIGCDGAHSTVRHASGLKFEGEWLTSTFLTADASVEWDLPNDECYIWFHEDGWLSAFPMKGGRWRLVADAVADSTPIDKIFAQRCPVAANVTAVDSPAEYRIPPRCLDTYQQGRVFIAGDAAHVQSPAAGQGMNTGIQDAFNLGWKLALVARGIAPPAVLKSYSAERTPIAGGILELNDHLTRIASIRRPMSQIIRNRLIPILAGFDVIEQRVNQRVAGTSSNYRRSPLVAGHGHWHGGPAPGDRMHVPASGRHELLLHTLGASEGDRVHVQNILRFMQDGYADLVDTRLDNDGPGLQMFLIRPDGYLAFRNSDLDPLPLLTYLSRHYAFEA